MSNTYFQFKQFRIDQTHSAMKVGTDGVLLGSWASIEKSKEILDIGCGTGLISLMVAQRNPQAIITAIDISESAIKDTLLNFGASPWADRLLAQNIELSEFAISTNKRFAHIVCNPPFFNRSLKSESQAKNNARHDDSLPFDKLFEYASKLLSNDGLLSIIIPSDRKEESIKIASAHNLFLQLATNVYPKLESEAPKRALLEFGLSENELKSSNLYIEKERHVYTDDYKYLTKAFYLSM